MGLRYDVAGTKEENKLRVDFTDAYSHISEVRLLQNRGVVLISLDVYVSKASRDADGSDPLLSEKHIVPLVDFNKVKFDGTLSNGKALLKRGYLYLRTQDEYATAADVIE